jgi:hypothetical protein
LSIISFFIDNIFIGGIHAVASALPLPYANNPFSQEIPGAKAIVTSNLNRIYNRELYQANSTVSLPTLPAMLLQKRPAWMKKLKPPVETAVKNDFLFDGDGDKDSDEDKRDSEAMREWQEVHALAIRPLVSGSMAAKYGFDGQDVTNKSKL